MKFYIITGERSGDMHAGNLIREIKKLDKEATVRGVGGEYLKEAGTDLSWHYSDIAIMGFAEVVVNFRRVMKKFSKVKEDIRAFRPDVLILVDFGGFNIRMAKFAKKNDLKVFYYITPKVWAWNQKRALTIKRVVDRMFVILPFEKQFYRKFDWEVDYVGNPVFDAVEGYSPDEEFLQKNNLPADKCIVALLPGSRKQELQKVIPLYKELTLRFPELHFVVAGVKNLHGSLYHDLEKLNNVSIIFEQTYDLLSNADAAVVTSGTATLETALFNVPQVVVYKTTGISYSIAKHFIRVKYISLVNLICNKEVVREMIQKDMTSGNVGDELKKLIYHRERRMQVLRDYEQIKTILSCERPASETAALLMIDDLRSEKN